VINAYDRSIRLSPNAILKLAGQRMAQVAARKQTIRESALRGASLALQSCEAREVILSGPARSSKTFGALYKFHRAAQTVPGARLLFIRQTRESLTDSALVTFEQDVVGAGHPITNGARRESRHSYLYPNGSEIIVAGFKQYSKDQTSKVMSTEYDMIFVNECNELMEHQWQQLTTRLTHFKTPYPQIVGDMNPPAPLHWTWRRANANQLTMLNAGLQDNPRWWDESTQAWTSEGQQVYATLDALTGILRDRLFLGKSVAAEGLVYGDVWDDGSLTGNVTELAEYESNAGPVYWFMDDGYSAGSAPNTRGLDPQTGYYVADAHPRVILFVQQKSDGHFDVFGESYACKKLSNEQIADAIAQTYPAPDEVTHGPGSAEIRGRLFEASLVPHQCTAKIEESIQELRNALAIDSNGWRRIRVHPRCKHLRAEMATYAYESGTDRPIKQFDHGPDALRYGIFILRFER